MEDMNEQVTLSSQGEDTPAYKIYSLRGIIGGTLLGGPLVTGYLMAKNFYAFGEPEKARKTIWISLGATVVIFSITFLLPANFPSMVLPAAYTFTAASLAQSYQGAKIKSHLDRGGVTQGVWKTLGIATLGLVITFTLVCGVVALFMLAGVNLG